MVQDTEALASIYTVNEGFENRLKSIVQKVTRSKELMEKLKRNVTLILIYNVCL